MRPLPSPTGKNRSRGAEILTHECNDRGWSLSEFARQVGMPRGQASYLLRGERRPSLELAAKLAQLVPMAAWLEAASSDVPTSPEAA